MNDQLFTMFTENDCTMIINSRSKEKNSRKTLIPSYHVADIVSVGWMPFIKSNLPEASIMMAKKMI